MSLASQVERIVVAILNVRIISLNGGQLGIINGMPQNTSYLSGKGKSRVVPMLN
jgi:hypothetical protein